MREQSGFLTLADEYQLFVRTLSPGEPKAWVVITHGYADHSGRYQHVMAHLARSGYAALAYDFRCHGQNVGRPGMIESIPQLVEDLRAVVADLRKKTPLPIFLLGHSTGGGVAALYAITYSADPIVKGLITTSPTIKIASHPLLQKIAGVVAAVCPTLKVVHAAGIEWLSRDPAVRAACENDRYFYKDKVMARTGYAILEGTKMIQAQLPKLTLPLLVLQAGTDHIVDPAGAKLLHDEARSADKAFKQYDGFYHEILNEIGKEEVLGDVVGWLDRH